MSAKGQRQRLIADWLRSGEAGSQEELAARLTSAGIPATQATVSRDLEEIGAVKLRRDGEVRYLLPEQVEAGHAATKLDRLLGEWVLSIVSAGPIVVLRTPPGSANLVANALDAASLPGIAGTIAGDDTIFVAVAEGTIGDRIIADLNARRDRA
ncbi:arginine repressor [Sphingomonas rhizophila]|uniref:Arginine repressor n=1 Tax=Sphingomonas rhizophila TaxID=2071607 RepID=A0A7G9SAY1_9SPHN|nr:arginine repressor [Sphingomonas rhizophila]QNN65006.1 arginine repressor [Sphingomonas rhizophila]